MLWRKGEVEEVSFEALVEDSRRQRQDRGLARRCRKTKVDRQLIPEKWSSKSIGSVSNLEIRRIRWADKSNRRRRPGIDFVLNSKKISKIGRLVEL